MLAWLVLLGVDCKRVCCRMVWVERQGHYRLALLQVPHKRAWQVPHRLAWQVPLVADYMLALLVQVRCRKGQVQQLVVGTLEQA
jgi:hypothetical protein